MTSPVTATISTTGGGCTGPSNSYLSAPVTVTFTITNSSTQSTPAGNSLILKFPKPTGTDGLAAKGTFDPDFANMPAGWLATKESDGSITVIGGPVDAGTSVGIPVIFKSSTTTADSIFINGALVNDEGVLCEGGNATTVIGYKPLPELEAKTGPIPPGKSSAEVTSKTGTPVTMTYTVTNIGGGETTADSVAVSIIRPTAAGTFTFITVPTGWTSGNPTTTTFPFTYPKKIQPCESFTFVANYTRLDNSTGSGTSRLAIVPTAGETNTTNNNSTIAIKLSM